MKNFFLHSLSVSALALLLASCSGTNKILPAAQLEGSWDIVQVGDEVLSPGQENSPFITFDLAQGRIWGNSGCNRMMGTFQTDSLQPGSLTFGAVASTRMACPDMAVENDILKALEAVRSFEGVAADDTDSPLTIALCDQKGKELLLLQQRPEVAAANRFDGLGRRVGHPHGKGCRPGRDGKDSHAAVHPGGTPRTRERGLQRDQRNV